MTINIFIKNRRNLMPGLARHGDLLDCGDAVIGNAPENNVFIEDKLATVRNITATVGTSLPHCHGATQLYPDTTTTDPRPNITINDVPVALQGDWNVEGIILQGSPNFPNGTGSGCGISCGSQCHDSQVKSTTTKVFSG
jgi:uncharacterized Zn-binding protein involved in type VI secretion